MLFQPTIVKKFLALYDQKITEKAWEQYSSFFLNEDIQANIHKIKEEQFQEGFLRELFVKVLGYTINPSPNYNLTTELKNEVGTKKADGAILIDNKVIGVIELKDHKTPDLASIEEQAFGYKSKHKDTRLVIISNFEKLRLYIDNAVEYREWDIFNMTEEEFQKLYLCLSWPQVKQNVVLQMKHESVSNESKITDALYKDYSQFKRDLFSDLLKRNPFHSGLEWASDEKQWQLLLFKKSQKLLDRLLFIFFAEDCGLLPPNSIITIIDWWQELKDNDDYRPFYDQIKKYFGYMNTGFHGKKYDIFAYNGGLFKPDEVLDSVTISDEILVQHTRKLSEYDFESDVDVNILGHIFENSLSEIEQITNKINNGETPQISKRKSDGVFYTPPFITKYIVENTIGRLCEEKKREIGIVEDDYLSEQRKQKLTKLHLLEKLTKYREWLLQLTILDPACGSGAFLNAALQYLIAEHKHIDQLEAKLSGSAIVFQDIENSILEHNLYGVDINEESVEIAQLSLWLRTAKPHRKLSTLNQNIKCGNSLISDPAIAGEKAFNWIAEFPKVFEKGGFDVVIGNPPYGAKVSKKEIDVFIKDFPEWGISKTLNDTYFVFYAKSLKDLVKPQGILGFIAPNTWKLIEAGASFRNNLMNSDFEVYKIAQYLDKVFEDATVDCDTLLIRKGSTPKTIHVDFIRKHEIVFNNLVDQTLLGKQQFYNLYLKKNDYQVKRKILNGSRLVGNELEIKNGVKPYEKGKGIPPQTDEVLRTKPYTSETRIDASFSPLIGGSYFNRYKITWNEDYWIKYGEWLAAPRERSTFDADEKLIFRQTSDSLIGSIIQKGYIMRNNTHIILAKDNTYDLRYVLACLNSKLLNYYYWTINPEKGEAMAEVKAFHLGLMPIKRIKKEYQQPFINLANKMLELNSVQQEKHNRFYRRLKDNFNSIKISNALLDFDQLTFAQFTTELKKQKIRLTLPQQDEWEEYFNQYKNSCLELSEQISLIDHEIDLKVYHLFGLTYEDILVVDPDTTISREEYQLN